MPWLSVSNFEFLQNSKSSGMTFSKLNIREQIANRNRLSLFKEISTRSEIDMSEGYTSQSCRIGPDYSF